MEYLADQPQGGQQLILCCQCGTAIEPNAANMCVACLRTQVDITEGIPKQIPLHFCRNCERYSQPPTMWVKATLESRELLSLCLKRIKGINKQIRLIDASFVWTEPHSKRLKVKLTIQKEVLGGAVLQQVFIVEFTVHNQMCDDCHRVEAKDYWRACVQIRQKQTSHKKTLYFLEQLILKHGAHNKATGIKQIHEGLDFFFAAKQDARKLTDFLTTVVPCKSQTAKELISTDIHSNTCNYKMTYSVEIVPLCKGNIVCLPAKLAQSLGNMSQICVVYQVTQSVHLIDPISCQVAELQNMVYWRYPFLSLCQPKQLVEYMVMATELISEQEMVHVSCRGQQSHKHLLADVYVVKISELGINDNQYHCRSHLGHLLKYGDTVLGFDLRNTNANDPNLDKMKPDSVPDVVLVRKLYGNSDRRMKKRKWKLRHLDPEGNAAEDKKDYNEFLEDLEEDATYRTHVNIYKDASKIAVDDTDTSSESDGEAAPKISLMEMLEDLHISEDATGEEGADMIE